MFKRAIVGAFLMLAGAGGAQACSCLPPGPPRQELGRAMAVFAGKVTTVRRAGDRGYDVTFQVERRWKGPSGQRLTLTTPLNSAACGYSFRKGVRYLVYAHRRDGGLTTNLCTRTRLLTEARGDLDALGPQLKN